MNAPCTLRDERIDPLSFLAGCLKRRLNQALSVLRLSLDFFARRYVRKRVFCWCLVSVRLSVTLVDRIETAEDIVKLLSQPGSPVILVFWPQAPVPNSKENPFNGSAKYNGSKNFAIFDRNRHLSWKPSKIGPWLLRNVNRKLYALYRMVTFSMILTNP